MRIAPLFELADIEFYRVDFGIYLGIVLCDDTQFLASFQHGDFSIFEIHHAVGVFHDGRRVRRQEKFIFAYAYGQRAALAGSNDGVGVPTVENGDGVGADDFVQRQLHGGQQVEVVRDLYVFDELHEDFGVGAALESVAHALEFLLDGGVVLDDAVVYERQVARSRIVGVGIDLVRLAVGGPTGAIPMCPVVSLFSTMCTKSATLPLVLYTFSSSSLLIRAIPALS